jgi:signal transduction histidine kinase
MAVQGKQQHWALTPGRRQAEIAGAPSELLSAMSNLVSNAMRYTPAGRH